jgi:hypothetical protein
MTLAGLGMTLAAPGGGRSGGDSTNAPGSGPELADY